MRTRTLGDSDLQVSVIGLGCNNFSRPTTHTETLEGTKEILDAAIDAGITFLDTADIYGAPPTTSETFMGEALQGRRDEVVLATKFGHQQLPVPGTDDWGSKGAATYVRQACDASLRRLRTDHIDLYQLHTPDPSTPIEETLGAMNELVTQGKVRYLGCSNFDAGQLREAARLATAQGWRHFISVQNEYSLLQREIEHEVLGAATETGAGVIPYFPLANGLLTGKYTKDSGQGRIRSLKPELLETTDFGQLDRFRAVCEDAGLPMVQVAIAWLLTREAVDTVIAGATRVEQIAQNAAAGDLELDP